jgi:dTDP-glucose 4,6-dehydratase
VLFSVGNWLRKEGHQSVNSVFVTGGCGFIGTNFVRYLLGDASQHCLVLNLDKMTYAGNAENLADVALQFPDRYRFFRGDIRNAELLDHIFTEFDPDAVVNFAAESHVDRSIMDPNLFIETNVLGTASLLAAARRHWHKDTWGRRRFLQVSTDEVYGSLSEHDRLAKFTEQTPLAPHSPYSASKASADMIVQATHDTYGLPVFVTRCSNNYGPYQFPEKLIPLMINNALNDKPLPVYGDGKNVRDWLYVEDHCHALWTVLQHARPGEVYNIGGNNEMQNIDIVRMLLDALGKPHSLISHVTDRLGHDRRYAIDASKIKADLGWQPRCVFAEKLKDTIDWYLANMEWVQHIVSGEYRQYYDMMYGGRRAISLTPVKDMAKS